MTQSRLLLTVCYGIWQQEEECPPRHGACSSATFIQEPDGFEDSGTTSEASEVGEDILVMTCSFVSATTRGVWYFLQGDGRIYEAVVEGDAFDAVLAVYATRSGCQGISCLGRDDYYYYYSEANEVLWEAITGWDYYILVTGLGNETGTYNFSVEVRLHSFALFCCLVALSWAD